MKKLLFVLNLLLLPLLAVAQVEVDSICYNLNADTREATVTSTKEDQYSGEIIIPATVTVDGIVYNVTSIGDYAFRGCRGLTSLMIPKGVTSIGVMAFFGCHALTSLTIPKGVTSIGYYAFEYCIGLTSIIVEEGNTVYDSRGNCNAIIETASNKLIRGCINTAIPEGVSIIGDGAFSGCSSLSSLKISESVTTIGEGAFWDCRGLTSLTIPDSLTEIGNYAFENCIGLTSLTIPKGVTKIGAGIFNDCPSLASINWESPLAVTTEKLGEISDNPNLLLYVDNAEQVTGLDFPGNIVVNRYIADLSLSEDYNFYAACPFTANNISYTHTYTMQSGKREARGWETITLPFPVQTITHESAGALTPFALYAAGQAEKPFWLGELTENGWQQAKHIEANKPYIICMPNHPDYNEPYNLAGRVTFSAQNVAVPKTEVAISTGHINGTAGDCSFVPVTLNTQKADSLFVLNVGEAYMADHEYPEGSVFVRGLRDIKPFEAYLTTSGGNAKRRYIPIGQSMETTGMYNVPSTMYNLPDGEEYYDLSGRRISKPTKSGVYLLKQGKTVQKVQVK